MTQKDAIAKAPVSRTKRTPLGRRNLLTIAGKELGFEYRIVNDNGDRVQRFQEAGWEFVPQKEVKVGDKRVENVASGEGANSVINVGGGQKAYVMRIQEDWYKEDQQAKQQHIQAVEAQTQQKALDAGGSYGNVDISRK